MSETDERPEAPAGPPAESHEPADSAPEPPPAEDGADAGGGDTTAPSETAPAPEAPAAPEPPEAEAPASPEEAPEHSAPPPSDDAPEADTQPDDKAPAAPEPARDGTSAEDQPVSPTEAEDAPNGEDGGAPEQNNLPGDTDDQAPTSPTAEDPGEDHPDDANPPAGEPAPDTAEPPEDPTDTAPPDDTAPPPDDAVPPPEPAVEEQSSELPIDESGAPSAEDPDPAPVPAEATDTKAEQDGQPPDKADNQLESPDDVYEPKTLTGVDRHEVEPDRYDVVDPDGSLQQRFADGVAEDPLSNVRDWVKNGNPHFGEGDAFDNNCADNSRAFADALHGVQQRIANGDFKEPPGEFLEMFEYTGTPRDAISIPGTEGDPTAYSQQAYQRIHDDLAGRPPGTAAIVGGDWASPDLDGGHWFNAYVDGNGEVRHVDMQSGHEGAWPPPYVSAMENLDVIVREPGGEWTTPPLSDPEAAGVESKPTEQAEQPPHTHAPTPANDAAPAPTAPIDAEPETPRPDIAEPGATGADSPSTERGSARARGEEARRQGLIDEDGRVPVRVDANGERDRGWPHDDTGYAIRPDDLDRLGITPEQVRNWQRFEAPLGMTPEQYVEFTSSLNDALVADGINPADVDIRLQGSSAQFFSGAHKNFPTEDSLRAETQPETAHQRFHDWMGNRPESDRPSRVPFDAKERLGMINPKNGAPEDLSDYDVQLSSDAMVRRANEAWDQQARHDSAHFESPKYDFVDRRSVREAFPALDAWTDRWEAATGREVAPALFRSSGPSDRSAQGISAHFRQTDWIIIQPDRRP